MGRGGVRAALPDQRPELRPLQNLRRKGPERQHHLGSTGGRRRAHLRGDVTPADHDCVRKAFSSEVGTREENAAKYESERLLAFWRPATAPDRPRYRHSKSVSGSGWPNRRPKGLISA